MSHTRWLCLLLGASLIFVFSSSVFAQCDAFMFAALDEEMQTMSVTAWTSETQCVYLTHFTMTSIPPGSALFGPDEEPQVECTRYSHDGLDRRIRKGWYGDEDCSVISPLPPGSMFDIQITGDFEGFGMLVYIEHVIVQPTGMLAINRFTPCADNVPPMMAPEMSHCFQVCHKVYHVPLMVPPLGGEPLISVTPGCMFNPCPEMPGCMPGGPNDYCYDVYESGGQWWLRFEYSNPMTEPVCYCVNYYSNLPPNYAVHSLGAWDELHQTMDLTFWTGPEGYGACGITEIFSQPPGAYIGSPWFEFSANTEYETHSIPIARGAFLPEDVFRIFARIDYGLDGWCADVVNDWQMELVRVTPEGGLEVIDEGGECDPGAVFVPDLLPFAVPMCIQVCHDIYHIPLDFAGPGTPEVSVTPGCDPASSPCSDPACNPGGPSEYRYELIQVGGSWILEFEHSNPLNEPACYCIQFYNIIPQPYEPRLLCALDETRQSLNVSLWSTDCMRPWNGEFSIGTNPPDKLGGGGWVESFFDVFCLPRTWDIPIGPAMGTLPGETFQILVECDFFGPGSDPFDGMIYTEDVIVTPSGQLARWDPSSPCIGDWVPPGMSPGQSECFQVCHRIYETILFYNPGGGRPSISVTPGCSGQPTDNCFMTPCVPGGPQDFVYEVYHNGVDWVLRFEYSNPYVEPVCYCVTYDGNVPYDCDTRELAALDEGHMNFDVSLHTFSYGGYECPADGNIIVTSVPEGAIIGPYPDSFFDVFTEWYSVEVPVEAGSFGVGETFQLVVRYDYTDPPYPDRWLTEDVYVNSSGYLNILDTGGQCTGDQVPMFMGMGESQCFEVCHRIYHVNLGWYDPLTPPIVTVTPGCSGPPQDECVTPQACTPGGPDDYRWDLRWIGEFWELEFEYSNEDIEPVCYCVTVNASSTVPPVTDLALRYVVEDIAVPALHFYWTAPVGGVYTIYACPEPNNWVEPPGEGWTDIHTDWYSAGDAHWSTELDPDPDPATISFRKYVIRYSLPEAR